MQDQMAAEAVPAEAQGQPADAKGGDNPQEALGALQKIQDAMMSIGSALEQSGAPKEAMAKLAEAASAYGEFLGMITGNQAPEAESKGMSMKAENAAPGSRPADMPVGKNVKAVPA